MAAGTYTEELPCGGKLSVTPAAWFIEYYFPGPDLRYNGTFLRIPDHLVPAYIEAFRANWKEFERLKKATPPGGTIEKVGAAGMTIRVGGRWSGVSIQAYHMPMNARAQIDRIISVYQYAIERVAEIQTLLRELS